MIPGKEETLRVSGTARIVRDLWVRELMSVAGRLPDFALIVDVREVFFHWDKGAWPQLAGLPDLARTMIDGGKLEDSLEEMQALIEKDARERLY